MEPLEDFLRTLPPSFKNRVTMFEPSAGNGFEAIVRSSRDTKPDVAGWVAEYGKFSETRWLVCRTYPNVERLEFREDLVSIVFTIFYVWIRFAFVPLRM